MKKNLLALGTCAFVLALGLVACDDSTSANSSPGDENSAEVSSSSILTTSSPTEDPGSSSSNVIASEAKQSSSSVIVSSSSATTEDPGSSSSVKDLEQVDGSSSSVIASEAKQSSSSVVSSSSVASSSSVESSSSVVSSSSEKSSSSVASSSSVKSSSSVASSSSAKSSSSSVVSSSSSSSNQIKDPSSSSVASSSSMKVAWAYLNPDIDYGTMTDTRDGQVYKTVKIGTQTWMAENLNYAPTNVSSMGGYAWSGCYNDKADSCAKYGRLYTWEVAMDKADCGYGNNCGNSYEGTQGVCPTGWHMPTKEEWQKLVKPMATSVRDYTTYWYYNGAGIELRTVDDWYSSSNKGTNASGFSALPAGYRGSNGSFYDAGYLACFWSASERNDDGAYPLRLYYHYDYAYLDYIYKSRAFSVRCVQN